MCLAVPGRIVSLSGLDPISRSGKVNFGGIVKDVCMAYCPEARVGEYVLVHVGFALQVIDEEEANRVFQYLHEMDELAELQEASA